MKLITKLGVVALTAITIVPLAGTISPVSAAAKSKPKTYKISKNFLKSKKSVLFKSNSAKKIQNGGVVISQTSAKNVQIVNCASMETEATNYKIKSQKVKGNQMTLKLTAKKSGKVQVVKGSGTLVIKRTGKNTYNIPSIYTIKRGHWYTINGKSLTLYNEKETMKKTSLKGLHMTTRANVKKAPGMTFAFNEMK